MSTLYYEITPYLEHHGIKGQKWGVRRFQNKDGTRTPAGRRREQAADDSVTTRTPMTREQKIAIGKKVIAGVAATATVAAAVMYVHKNPEKIGKVISKFRGVKLSEVKDKAVAKGKEHVKTFFKTTKDNFKTGVKEGWKEFTKEAPKKVVKTVGMGIALNVAKRSLDKAVGKEEAAKIFQANDNKKIAKFWKVAFEDQDDKTDDDD